MVAVALPSALGRCLLTSLFPISKARLMEIREYEKSEKWCLRLSEQYPDQLSSYTCKLKLYFVIKNREAFFQTLDGLKASDVVIDNETLELVRIFS